MLNIFNSWNDGHQYTLVLLSTRKTISKIFNSREAANAAMYKLIGKYRLSLRKIYDDNHDKTYICNNGVEFHINRV